MHTMSFKNNQSLPLSQQKDQTPSIRRRLSSLSLKSMTEYSSPATSWALRRSESVSSISKNAGNSIAKWWTWGWDWILSRKPTFALDLEMNEDEKRVIGCQNKGSLRHVFFKLNFEIKKIVGDKAKVVGKYESVGSCFKKLDNRRNMIPY
ncbi:hypothetical protein LIER_03702 [Lithospermum erythrorhizon]|uniref:Uncharacterized protein n=1 Tax=Lithospermum erythrorhizon TaxID=34254 RepID=A0AAV3NU84_LITER